MEGASGSQPQGGPPRVAPDCQQHPLQHSLRLPGNTNTRLTHTQQTRPQRNNTKSQTGHGSLLQPTNDRSFSLILSRLKSILIYEESQALYSYSQCYNLDVCGCRLTGKISVDSPPLWLNAASMELTSYLLFSLLKSKRASPNELIGSSVI